MIGHSLTKLHSPAFKVKLVRVHLGINIIHAGLDSEIIIDDNTGVAARCSLYSASNAYARDKRMSGPMAKENHVYTKYGKILIEKECFIGVGSIVLPNVKIGFAAIVPPGAVIKKNLQEKGIYDVKGDLLKEYLMKKILLNNKFIFSMFINNTIYNFENPIFFIKFIVGK